MGACSHLTPEDRQLFNRKEKVDGAGKPPPPPAWHLVWKHHLHRPKAGRVNLARKRSKIQSPSRRFSDGRYGGEQLPV